MIEKLKKQMALLETLNVDSREYQVALARITTTTKAMLAGTSSKIFPEAIEVESAIKEALKDCQNPDVDMQDYFKEYGDFLDGSSYKNVIQESVKLEFKNYCNSEGMPFVYTKLLARVTTLRKLRTVLEIFQYILDLKRIVKENRAEIDFAEQYPKNLLEENAKLKNELDAIYEVYTFEDESVDKALKVMKLKKDGCTEREIVKILGIPKTSLRRLVGNV